MPLSKNLSKQQLTLFDPLDNTRLQIKPTVSTYVLFFCPLKNLCHLLLLLGSSSLFFFGSRTSPNKGEQSWEILQKECSCMPVSPLIFVGGSEMRKKERDSFPANMWREETIAICTNAKKVQFWKTFQFWEPAAAPALDLPCDLEFSPTHTGAALVHRLYRRRGFLISQSLLYPSLPQETDRESRRE